MGSFNGTIGVYHRTNFSYIRVRTKRNCLVSRFLSPCAGGHGSGCNNSLRGHVHFVHRILTRIVHTTNGSVNIIIGAGVCSKFGDNLRISSYVAITGTVRTYNIRKVILSTKFIDGTPVTIVYNTVPLGALTRCVSP